MKLLILPTILLSLSAFAGAPDCQSLAQMISGMEADLQRKSFKDCKKVEIKDFLKEGATADAETIKSFEENRCESLGKMETEITKLEGQLATIRALQEFSKDLGKKHAVLKNVTTSIALDKEISTQGKHLQTGLKTAYVMESLLALKKPDFLLALKERTDTGNLTQRDFQAVYDKSCPAADYCKSIDSIKEYLLDENVLVQIGIAVKKSTLDSKSIDAMRAALAIKPVEQDKSKKQSQTPPEQMTYASILASLNENKINLAKIDDKSPMDRNLIKAIKAIKSFEPMGDLDYLAVLKKSKDALETKSTIDSFKYMTKDVSVRNEMTMKSKLSAIIYKLDSGKQLSDESKTACATLLDPKVTSEECLKSLKKTTATLDNVYESEKIGLESIQALSDSNAELKKFENSCLDSQLLINNAQLSSGPDPLKDCKSPFLSSENELSKKLTALNLLRGKLLQENKKIQDFRNFAIEKLEDQSCKQPKNDLLIGDCGGVSLDNITPALKVLSGDMLKVAVVYKEDSEVDIESYCEGEEKNTESQEKICEFLEDEGLPNRAVANNDNASAPTEIDNSRINHDIKMNALQGAINNIAGALGRQNQTYYSPYNYNNPYASSAPPMTISDSLTYNSIYYGGYGGYYPMANSSPFMYNSQLLRYSTPSTGSGSLYSYSTTGGVSAGSSYGLSNFLPTFSF